MGVGVKTANSRTTVLKHIAERSTRKYTVTLKDEEGSSPSTLDSLAVTILDVDSAGVEGTPINGRDDQDILNVNGGTYAAGLISLTLAPADNVVVNTGQASEIHRLTLDARWNGGAGRENWEVDLTIDNLSKIT